MALRFLLSAGELKTHRDMRLLKPNATVSFVSLQTAARTRTDFSWFDVRVLYGRIKLFLMAWFTPLTSFLS